MNIIFRELRANLKPFIIWMASLSVMFLAVSTEFSAFRDNPEILDALEGFGGFYDALGITMDNIITPEGFVSMMSVYLYVPIAIYAALLGSSIISKEERDKTAEYLFTLPIKREAVLRSKIIAGFMYVLFFVIVVITGVIIAFYRFGLSDSFYNFMVYLGIGLIFIGLIFMSIGMFFASYLKQYKRSGAITLAITISTYMLNMVVRIVDELDFLKYFIPYEYFEVQEMLNGNIEFIYVLLSLIIISVSIIGVFVFYKKRDLYI